VEEQTRLTRILCPGCGRGYLTYVHRQHSWGTENHWICLEDNHYLKIPRADMLLFGNYASPEQVKEIDAELKRTGEVG
jgi:hypothetical protein